MNWKKKICSVKKKTNFFSCAPIPMRFRLLARIMRRRNRCKVCETIISFAVKVCFYCQRVLIRKEYAIYDREFRTLAYGGAKYWMLLLRGRVSPVKPCRHRRPVSGSQCCVLNTGVFVRQTQGLALPPPTRYPHERSHSHSENSADNSVRTRYKNRC